MNFTVIGPVYPYRGGIAHYTSQLVLAMKQAGHCVQTISFKRQYPVWLYPGKSDKDPSQVNWQVDAQYLLDPINPTTWWSTSDKISEHKPDLVAIQWWTTFWGPSFACMGRLLRQKNLRICYILHNVLPHEQRFFDPFLAKIALSQGHAFLAQTEREKKKLLQMLPGRTVTVSRLPTYSFLANRKLPKEEARQIIKIPVSRPVILFFGIVRPYKGLKYLIDSIAILKRNNPNQLPFVLIAGEIWEDKSAFQSQIENLDLGNCIRLDDRYVPDEEAAILFSAADLLVAPYIDGTQSAAVGMALGFDLPIVVSDVIADGIAEENKQDIWVVRAGDAEDLAQAIQEVIARPQFASPTHDRDKEWKGLIECIEELA